MPKYQYIPVVYLSNIRKVNRVNATKKQTCYNSAVKYIQSIDQFVYVSSVNKVTTNIN